MECCNEVQAGIIGLQVVLTVRDHNGQLLDLSEASALTMTFKPPTGASVTQDAELGEQLGEITYTSTDEEEFELPGAWRVQGAAAFPDGAFSKTSITKFTVKANL